MIPQGRSTTAKLIFDGTSVLELLIHAKAAPKTTSPYSLTDNSGPGMFFVVYARSSEALPQTASLDDRMDRYEKVRSVAGGDDFAEFLPAKRLEKLE
jgi:hypothetical protein